MKKQLNILFILIATILLSACGPSTKQIGTNIEVAKKATTEDLNKKDENGYTALHHAAQSGNFEIVKYLVSSGINIDEVDNKGRTAIEKATYKGYVDIVKFLSESGANLEIKNSYGETPLHIAASTKKIAILKFLIDAKADLNSVDNRGWTAIHNASINGNLNIIKILVENYADVHISDNKGQTALDIAKDKAVIAYLTEVSSPTYVQMQKDFIKAKETHTIQAFETFIATYPKSSKVPEAETLITLIYKEILGNPEKQKEILANIMAFLEKKDIDGLLNYANTNPEVKEFARNHKQIYLLFTGPKELQIGKILQYKNEGVSSKMLSSKILNLHKPYKKFSIDEMQILKNFNLSDDIIIAMIDVTTSIDDENRSRQTQLELLNEQEKLAKRNKVNNIQANNQNVQVQVDNTGTDIASEVMKTVGKEVISELVRQLF